MPIGTIRELGAKERPSSSVLDLNSPIDPPPVSFSMTKRFREHLRQFMPLSGSPHGHCYPRRAAPEKDSKTLEAHAEKLELLLVNRSCMSTAIFGRHARDASAP